MKWLLFLLLLELTACQGSCRGCDDFCTSDCPPTCAGKATNHPIWTEPPRFIRKVPNGKLYHAGPPDLSPPISLVHVYGTAFEMGEAQGKLLATEMAAFLPAAIQYVAEGITAKDIPPEMADAYARAGVEGCLDWIYNATSPYIGQEFIEELRGLAAGSGELRNVMNNQQSTINNEQSTIDNQQ